MTFRGDDLHVRVHYIWLFTTMNSAVLVSTKVLEFFCRSQCQWSLCSSLGNYYFQWFDWRQMVWVISYPWPQREDLAQHAHSCLWRIFSKAIVKHRHSRSCTGFKTICTKFLKFITVYLFCEEREKRNIGDHFSKLSQPLVHQTRDAIAAFFQAIIDQASPTSLKSFLFW